MFITLQVGRCNVLSMGNNKTTNPPYNVMTLILSLGRSMLKLHCILYVFVLIEWIEIDGDLALIDPTKSFLRGEFIQDQREDSKENPKMTHKLVVLVPSPSLYLSS